jgi:vancomycin resistance protein YoaR
VSERERAGGRVVVVLVLALALLLGGGYAAAYALAGDDVARGTTVAGVDIGGRSRAEAVAALRRELRKAAQRPVTVTVEGRSVRVAPREAGLGVDYEASVAQAGSTRGWQPSRLWDHYAGGSELDAVLTEDPARMAAVVSRLDAAVGSPPRDGAVEFRDGRIEVTHARPGEGLDGEELRGALASAYLDDEPVADVALHAAAPRIDEDDVHRALEEFANPALSASVTLVFDRSRVRLRPRDFAGVLGMRAEGGRLVPDLDQARLARLVGGAINEHRAPVDAAVAIVGGRPTVVPARSGVSYRPADVTDAFLHLVTRTDGRRQMHVRATVAEPDFTTKDARRLAVREMVSTFTTHYPHAASSDAGLTRAAELVDGTVLRPGDTFSLDDTVGERTRANGSSDGILEDDLGGGFSQLATTTFNAMLLAGLADVEHQPQSFSLDRHPVGRDATVAGGAVDLRFRNDTRYGVLVSAHVTPSTPSSRGVVTVSMWSTKVWDVSVTTSERYRVAPPATRTLHTRDCHPSTGDDGFDIDVTRHFRRHGSDALDHDEVFHTRYPPSDTVVCG